MPKFDKPDSPNVIWGVNALEEDLTRPDDSYIQTGWTQVKPPYEYENYSMNKLYQGFAYYNQLGFPEWDSVTEYQAGKSYVQVSDNRIYKCIQTHTNRNPATAGNEAYWEVFEGNRQATTTSRGTTELATNTEALQGLSSAVSLVPSNFKQHSLSQNGYQKIPGGLIIQWGVLKNVPHNQVFQQVTFPIPFPTTAFNILATIGRENAANGTVSPLVKNLTTDGVLIAGDHDDDPTSGDIYWFAVGY